VLVLAGEHDQTFPKSSYDAVARAFGADIAVLPQLPHAMAIDRRWQVAADSILAWLEQQGL